MLTTPITNRFLTHVYAAFFGIFLLGCLFLLFAMWGSIGSWHGPCFDPPCPKPWEWLRHWETITALAIPLLTFSAVGYQCFVSKTRRKEMYLSIVYMTIYFAALIFYDFAYGQHFAFFF